MTTTVGDDPRYPWGRGPRLRRDISEVDLPVRERGGVGLLRIAAATSAEAEGARWSIVTTWAGRVSAVMSVAVFVLVISAVEKGMEVQTSAGTIVSNFTETNEFFEERADFTATQSAREALEELDAILGQLDRSTASAVATLGVTIPDLQTLLSAATGDSELSRQLESVGAALQTSASSIGAVAADASSTVAAVDGQLTTITDLINQLNGELAQIQRKVGILPPLGGTS